MLGGSRFPDARLVLNTQASGDHPNLIPSRLNPILPDYLKLNIEFDFNHNPMEPPGIGNLVHNNPHNRVTWDPHGHKGWYDRPDMLHYRCLTS